MLVALSHYLLRPSAYAVALDTLSYVQFIFDKARAASNRFCTAVLFVLDAICASWKTVAHWYTKFIIFT